MTETLIDIACGVGLVGLVGYAVFRLLSVFFG